MQRYYLTFGSQYAVQDHPYDSRVHPDGWFVVEAEDEGEARRLAFTHLDSAWSMIYTEDEWLENWPKDGQWYPLGELARLTVEEPPC